MQSPPQTFKTMILLTLLSALFISSVAAWFSIAGLIAIFPGAKIAVGLMGAALELGKLVAASWLYQSWGSSNKLMKMYFFSAVTILSLITSIGIFGYLTRAHVEGTQGLNAGAEQVALLDDQIAIEKQTIVSSRAALQQMDAAVNNLVGNEKTTERALAVRTAQRTERASLTKDIFASNSHVVELEKQKSLLNKDQRKLETEVGPIKYFAQLVYSTDNLETIDKAIRMLILMLIFVFDPLAILLVIATNMQLAEKKTTDTEKISPTKNLAKTLDEKHKSKIMLDFGDASDNVTALKADWNPGAWFKIVKKPK